MTAALLRIPRLLLRRPATLLVVVAAVVALVLRSAAATEAHLGGLIANAAGCAVAVVAVGFAERILGTLRTVFVGVVASAASVATAWGILTVGARLGEAFSSSAVGEALWGPSVIAAALAMAVSAGASPSTRRLIRGIVLVLCTMLLLYDGHALDLTRLLAAGAGGAFGAILMRERGPRRPIALPRPPLRRILSGVLFLVGTGTLCGAVLPETAGFLSPFSDIIGPVASLVVGGLLVVSAALLLAGRFIGLVLALAAQGVAIALLISDDVIAVVLDQPIRTDLSLDEWEWQLALIAVWALPVVTMIALVLTAPQLVRRRPGRPTTSEHGRILTLLERSGAGTMGHMSSWDGNSYWFAPDGRGAVAYRVHRGVALTVSDPIAEPSALRDTMIGFAEHCERAGWIPVFYSVHDEVAAITDELGWSRTSVGTETVLALDGFSLSGRRRQDLRTAVNRAAREGVVAEWTTFAALSPAAQTEVEDLCAGWTDHKSLPEMGFTLGGLRELRDPAVRLMLARGADGTLQGVTSWLPNHDRGDIVGWTLDVMRRADGAMPGVMEFLIATTALRCAEAGLVFVSLSGTPLAPHAASGDRLVDRLLLRLAAWLEPAYGFSSLRRFKQKFGSDETALWMAYPSRRSLPRIAPALAAAYAPDLKARDVVHLMRMRGSAVRAGAR